MMKRTEAHQFIKARSIALKNGQYMLTEPVFAFKKVHDSIKYGKDKHLIANLVIPAGAVVNLGTEKNLKMRATQAYCFSLVKQYSRDIEVHNAVSTYYTRFEYKSGKKLGLKMADLKNLTVDAEKYIPSYHKNGSYNIRREKIINALTQSKCNPDSWSNCIKTCGHGIHFFLDVDAALNY